jgi:hypothetical protein
MARDMYIHDSSWAGLASILFVGHLFLEVP